MLEEMDSPDVQDFWIFYMTNEERFIRDNFTKEQIALACFKAGIDCQKKKLIVRKRNETNFTGNGVFGNTLLMQLKDETKQ